MSLISKILSGAIAFTAGLSQTQTNGNSVLGTLSAPSLTVPKVNPRVSSIDPVLDIPDTNRTVSYVFNISRVVLSPDGYQKEMILVNGAFPGPVIEANWGDWISVTVNNQIENPTEGTTIHWHGVLQRESPWADGVPGGQQCPIAPGKSMTYRYRADSWGTSWYHSHFSAQYTQGVVGPIVIHGPNHVPYDVDLGPVLITDMFHKHYKTLVEEVMGTNSSLFAHRSDNNLINGKMFFDCSLVTDGTPCTSNAGLSEFRFIPGKTHRLRVINGGSAGLQHFSIDNHVMIVIANDFIPVEPYESTVLTMGVGQRADILVTANQDPNSTYWMRSNISSICGLPNQPAALGVISYAKTEGPRRGGNPGRGAYATRRVTPTRGANPNPSTNTSVPATATQMPSSTPWPFTETNKCNNHPLNDTTPVFPMPVKTPTTTIYLGVNAFINSTGNLLWTVNGQTFRDDDTQPILLLANRRNASNVYHPDWSVYNLGTNSTIRMIIQNEQAAATNISHPMHLHGHDFQVLNEGDGTWDGTTIINPENPNRRDTQMLRPGGHIVLQFEADNPGLWPLHCHVAWHVSQGLYINLLEQPDAVKRLHIPNELRDTCRAWVEYRSEEAVQYGGSGL